MACIFCDNEEIRDRIIIENEYAFVFPTNIPIVPGHVLICSKRCVSTFDNLSMDDWGGIYEIIKIIKPALKKAFSATGFNYALNEGEIAGQNVAHIHFHLLPRKDGDTGVTEYDPRKFLYRPGSRKESPKEELIDIAKTIKSFIEQFNPNIA